MKHVFLTASALLLLAGRCPADQLALKWNDLGPVVTGSKVALVLPSGVNIEGKVNAVEPEGLRLRVTRTSDKKVVRKGEQVIPRASVSVMHMTKHRKLGRILCTAGAVGLAGIIIAAQDIDLYEGALTVIVPVVAAGGVIGAGVAGYYIGKRLDRRVTDIRIVPGD